MRRHQLRPGSANQGDKEGPQTWGHLLYSPARHPWALASVWPGVQRGASLVPSPSPPPLSKYGSVIKAPEPLLCCSLYRECPFPDLPAKSSWFTKSLFPQLSSSLPGGTFSISFTASTPSSLPLRAGCPVTQTQASEALSLCTHSQDDLISLVACDTIYTQQLPHLYLQSGPLSASQTHISNCLLNLSTWMSQMHLKPNVSKTQLLGCLQPSCPAEKNSYLCSPGGSCPKPKSLPGLSPLPSSSTSDPSTSLSARSLKYRQDFDTFHCFPCNPSPSHRHLLPGCGQQLLSHLPALLLSDYVSGSPRISLISPPTSTSLQPHASLLLP